MHARTYRLGNTAELEGRCKERLIQLEADLELRRKVQIAHESSTTTLADTSLSSWIPPLRVRVLSHAHAQSHTFVGAHTRDRGTQKLAYKVCVDMYDFIQGSLNEEAHRN